MGSPLAFAPGETDHTFTVPTTADSLAEYDEIVATQLTGAGSNNVNLGGPYGGPTDTNDSFGRGTITDDEAGRLTLTPSFDVKTFVTPEILTAHVTNLSGTMPIDGAMVRFELYRDYDGDCLGLFSFTYPCNSQALSGGDLGNAAYDVTNDDNAAGPLLGLPETEGAGDATFVYDHGGEPTTSSVDTIYACIVPGKSVATLTCLGTDGFTLLGSDPFAGENAILFGGSFLPLPASTDVTSIAWFLS